MKSQINILKLVYPPISNQEAEWIKDEPDVAKELQKSNLYMIVQRHEAKFYFKDEEATYRNMKINFQLEFIYKVGNISNTVIIDFHKLFKMRNISEDSYKLKISFGEKKIEIWLCDINTNKELDLLEWFTTEKLLWDKWRKHSAILGLEDINTFSQYYLHYVGISKKTDSLTRLVVKPHDKRLRILSNENSLSYKARLTDEIILLFFEIKKLEFLDYDENNIQEFLYGLQIEKNKMIADAEKAFIHILSSKYNSEKYKNYPKCTDGLYNEGLSSYSYFIGEDLTLFTDTDNIKGGYVSEYNFPDYADAIIITNNKVFLHKSPIKL